MSEQGCRLSQYLRCSLIVLLAACAGQPSFVCAQRQVGGPVGDYSDLEAGRAAAFRDGGTVLRVILPFHLAFDSDTRLCSQFNDRSALQYVEAVRLAADLVQNSSLLGNMSVGFIILDSCSSVDHVGEHLKRIERFVAKKECHHECPIWSDPDTGKVIINMGLLKAVIGLESSAIVQSVAPIISEFTIPLISHAAASHLLTDTIFNTDYLQRTIPDERFEAMAILDLVTFFNWTHVGLIAPLEEHALTMYSHLHRGVAGRPICFGIQTTYSSTDQETAREAARKIKNIPLINAVILLGDLKSSLPFIRAVSDLNTTNRLVWIMTSAWGKDVWNLPLDVPEYQAVASMRTVFFPQPVPAGPDSPVGDSWQTIATMLQNRLRYADQQAQDLNPWFNKTWNATLERICAASLSEDEGSGMVDVSSRSISSQHRSKCSLKSHTFPLYDSLLLIDAFFQTAKSADNMYRSAYERSNCSLRQTINCSLVKQVREKPEAWGSLNITQKFDVKKFVGLDAFGDWNFVNTATGLTGFDPKKIRYDIYFAQPSGSIGISQLKLKTFGYWTPQEGPHISSALSATIKMEVADIVSSCPQICPPGTRQTPTFAAYARRCCWKTCAPCTGRSFSRFWNSSKCEKCGKGHAPSSDHTSCDMVFRTSQTERTAFGAAICFAAVGFILAAVTLVLFYKHKNEFIVKTSDYMLSMGMLEFHALTFLSVVLLFVEPSNSVCVSRVLIVLPWPILYVACILVKTNRLRALFRHSSKLSTRRILLLSNKTQGIFVASLGSLTAAFLVIWAAFDTPKVHFVFHDDHTEKACDLSNAWMGVYFGGTLSLLLASLVLAFLAHNLPADFNEASFLLLSTSGITFFWIILIPAYYFSTSVRSDTLLALIITSQGLVTMFCLFTRRLYYIFRPMSEAEIKSRRMLSRSQTKLSRVSMASRAASMASLRSKASEHGTVHEPVDTQIGEDSRKKPAPETSAVKQTPSPKPPERPSEANNDSKASEHGTVHEPVDNQIGEDSRKKPAPESSAVKETPSSKLPERPSEANNELEELADL